MAPILTSFSRYVVSDQCSTSMGNANVSYGSRLCENSGRKSVGATIDLVIADA